MRRMDAVRTERILVTPELAREWLATSTINRRLKQTAVLEYAIAMDRGEWRPDAPPITFAGDGRRIRLLNGHHRCHAVIFCGKSVEMTVQFGVSEDTREVEDSGINRSLADKLTMFRPEVQNVAQRIANLRLCVQLLSPDVRVRSLSDYDHWMSIFGKGVDWSVKEFAKATNRFKRAPVAGAMAFAHKTDQNEVEIFGHAVATGVDLKAGQPSHTLRKFLESPSSIERDSKSRRVISRKVLAAIRAHLSGQQLWKVQDSFDAVKDFNRPYNVPKVASLVAPWEQGFEVEARTEPRKRTG